MEKSKASILEQLEEIRFCLHRVDQCINKLYNSIMSDNNASENQSRNLSSEKSFSSDDLRDEIKWDTPDFNISDYSYEDFEDYDEEDDEDWFNEDDEDEVFVDDDEEDDEDDEDEVFVDDDEEDYEDWFDEDDEDEVFVDDEEEDDEDWFDEDDEDEIFVDDDEEDDEDDEDEVFVDDDEEDDEDLFDEYDKDEILVDDEETELVFDDDEQADTEGNSGNGMMNITILSVTDLNKEDKTTEEKAWLYGNLYQNMTGFIGMIPAIEVGKGMYIYYPRSNNTPNLRVRIHTSSVNSHSEKLLSESMVIHMVKTENSIYTFIEYKK